MRNSFAATLVLLYVLPVILLSTGLIPFKWRFHVLVAIAACAVGLSVRQGYGLAALGISAPNPVTLSIWALLPIILLGSIVVIADLRNRQTPIASLGFFVFFVLLSAPAQEFIYRSFLFAQMNAVTQWSGPVKILVSATLYSLMHLIYHDGLTIVLTFAIGLVWGAVYLQTRNFAVVAVSHATLGAVAIFLGVI